MLRSPSSNANPVSKSVVVGETAVATGALDQISSADIAVHVAYMTNLPEAPSVVNNADSINLQLAVSPSDDSVIAKPQVVATSLKSYKDIIFYKTVKGDTIPKIAKKFGITSDTVRWSNGLQGDNVDKGTTLLISPVNGVVYKVTKGDTIDKIATKFSANKQQLIADNDAELGKLKPGRLILVRGGKVASPRLARVASPSGFAWGGGRAVYGPSNGYDYGYCTWYAANRRAQIGKPLPSNLGNASTWKALAARAGFSIGNRPKAGAVIWTPPRDYYGHVGFVEKVNKDGSALISEMNVRGWAVRSTATLSASEASRYSYIY